MLHNMIKWVVMMRRLAALTVSCLSALVADGRPTQTARGAIDPNGRPTVANGRPTQTPCGAHSAHTLVMVSATWVSRRARSSVCETKRAQLIDVPGPLLAWVSFIHCAICSACRGFPSPCFVEHVV